MGWQINFDADKSVDLDDLAPEVFDKIARDGIDDDPGITWWTVYNFPLANTARLYRVICAAADVAGVPPPAEPVRAADMERLVDMIDPTTPVDKKPFMDGNPQMPDEPEVGSSSTSPGVTDGPKTSADDSPSSTS